MSVVAWGVGQWWDVLGTCWFGGTRVMATHCAEGVNVSWNRQPTGEFDFSVRLPAGDEVALRFLFAFEKLGPEDNAFRLPGIVYGQFFSAKFVSLRHWLIISALTLFNVALWWYYRKSKEVTPCES